MDVPPAFRISLLLAAGGLAACAAPGDAPAPVLASVMLVSKSSPTLALISDGLTAPPAPNANALVAKAVDATGMAALVATFEAEQMFAHALPDVPQGARQAIVLDRGGARSVWAFAGDAQDQRYVAFVKARSYFLQLFNHARNYVPAEQDAGTQMRSSGDRAGALRAPLDSRGRS